MNNRLNNIVDRIMTMTKDSFQVTIICDAPYAHHDLCDHLLEKVALENRELSVDFITPEGSFGWSHYIPDGLLDDDLCDYDPYHQYVHPGKKNIETREVISLKSLINS